MSYFFARIFLGLFVISVALASENHYRNYGDRRKNNLRLRPMHAQGIGEPGNTTKLHLKVYYETLCPGSVTFIVEQLKPAAVKLAPYLDLHLVPYGHASTTYHSNGRYQFKCQHGPAECYGNKLHACAIHMSHNATAGVLLTACLMEYSLAYPDSLQVYNDEGLWSLNACMCHNAPESGALMEYSLAHQDFVQMYNTERLQSCSQRMYIPTEAITACLNSHSGSVLLMLHGRDTAQRRISYVPYVTINGQQPQSMYNLLSTLCSMLPNDTPECR